MVNGRATSFTAHATKEQPRVLDSGIICFRSRKLYSCRFFVRAIFVLDRRWRIILFR